MRPTIVVAETEPLAALSVRKLVLESAKFNVLTAHSASEAIEILGSGPKLVRAAVIVSDLRSSSALAAKFKKARPDLPVIYASPNRTSVEGADHAISSHDPEGLVRLCRELLGDPRQMETQTRTSPVD